MRPLHYTLLCDGPTDRALIPVINWILGANVAICERGFVDQLADLRSSPLSPRSMEERITVALDQFPCDLFFIHRDAERETAKKRIGEIEEAAESVGVKRYVPVVPVRMTEAWLLIDAVAIRHAADNPNGKVDLSLPAVDDLEAISNPKRMLRSYLLTASEKSGRRRRQFERDIARRAVRVSEYIDDFSPLRGLTAFRQFEEAANKAISDFVLEVHS